MQGRIDSRVCAKTSLGIDDLAGRIDFALAFAVVHEVPDKERFLTEIRSALKDKGRLLIAEPRGHVPKREFEKTTSAAVSAGFAVVGAPALKGSHAVLLER